MLHSYRLLSLVLSFRSKSVGLDLLHDIRLKDISNLDVIELLKSNTALVAAHDLACVVLESLERGNLILKDHDAVTNHADLRLSCDLTVLNIASRNRTDVGNVNGLTNLCVTEQILAELGIEHTLHCRLDLLQALVNDAIGANVNVLTLCRVDRALIGSDVESDDDRIGSRREGNVTLGDSRTMRAR